MEIYLRFTLVILLKIPVVGVTIFLAQHQIERHPHKASNYAH